MYYVYILESINTGRHYVGSAEVLLGRLDKHNAGSVRSTKAYRPWKIIHSEKFETRSEACLRELEIKSYKGGFKFKELIGEVA